MRLRSGTGIILALVAGAASLRADILHLKDGRKIEGKIVEEEGGNYVVKLKGGTMKIAKKDVSRVEARKLPEEEFQGKLAALKTDDIPGLMGLATWCKEQGLKKEEREVLGRIVRLEPKNEEANLALGNIKVNGEWVSPSEAKSLKEKAEAAEKEAQGLAFYKGKWIPREDKENLEKGLVLHDGKWLTPEQLKESQGLVKIGDKWVPKSEKVRAETVQEFKDKLKRDAACSVSEHFKVVHVNGQEIADKLAQQAEECYKYFNELFGLRETKKHWTLTADYYVVDSDNLFKDFVDTIATRYVKDKSAIDWIKRPGSDDFHNSKPAPIACHVLKANQDEEGHICHIAGHFLLNWHTSVNNPDWLVEGFASFMEVKFREASRVRCSTRATYGGSAKVAEKAKDFAAWKDLVKESVLDKQDTPMLQMKEYDLNRLDFEHLSKSWSVVTFLITEHKDKFVKWIEGIKKGEPQDRALFLAFNWKVEELDDAWRKWVKSNY